MGLSRLGGVCMPKLGPSMAFALFVVLTLVGFAQPAHASPLNARAVFRMDFSAALSQVFRLSCAR